MNRTRNQFTTSSLLKLVGGVFKQEHQDSVGGYGISTSDCLKSGLAMFSLKYPSLLQFDKDSRQKTLRHNLKTLYGVDRAPCDTRMRERLDGLDLKSSRLAMSAVISRLQRSKVLEEWKFLEKHYLVSLDGTGFFSSSHIQCSHCCETHHRNGTVTYSHKMVVGSIVNPNLRQVLPIGFEPIIKEDGDQKNDCERNASKRWLKEYRQRHPQLPTVILADGLSANGPFIDLLEQYRCHYILVCKKDDHAHLWEWFWAAEDQDVLKFEDTLHHTHYSYRVMQNVPLSDSRSDKRVTVIYYEETPLKGKKQTWGWVTDLSFNPENIKGDIRNIVKGARARWKIENETFNTLKNQGYHFEHNYGHGFKTLSNVLAGLMLLAFLIDQCLEAINLEFQTVLKKMGQRIRLWEKIRSGFQWLSLPDWQTLYRCILDPPTFVV